MVELPDRMPHSPREERAMPLRVNLEHLAYNDDTDYPDVALLDNLSDENCRIMRTANHPSVLLHLSIMCQMGQVNNVPVQPSEWRA
jgi:hypothetical protein